MKRIFTITLLALVFCSVTSILIVQADPNSSFEATQRAKPRPTRTPTKRPTSTPVTASSIEVTNSSLGLNTTTGSLSLQDALERLHAPVSDYFVLGATSGISTLADGIVWKGTTSITCGDENGLEVKSFDTKVTFYPSTPTSTSGTFVAEPLFGFFPSVPGGPCITAPTGTFTGTYSINGTKIVVGHGTLNQSNDISIIDSVMTVNNQADLTFHLVKQ